jgi:hypothetical protein
VFIFNPKPIVEAMETFLINEPLTASGLLLAMDV